MHRNNKLIFIFLVSIFFIIIIQYYLGINQNKALARNESELAKGIIFLQNKQYAESEEILEKYKDTSFGHSYFFNYNYVQVLVENGKYARALEYYKKIYNIQPRYLLDKNFVDEINRIEEIINNEK